MNSATAADIDKIIENEYAAFYHSPYKQKMSVELPLATSSLFEKALFKVPPQIHNLQVPKLRELLGKYGSGYTMVEVGIILNVILAASFDVLYKDLEEAFEIHGQFEVIRNEYNKLVADMDARSKKKRESLMVMANPHMKNRAPLVLAK